VARRAAPAAGGVRFPIEAAQGSLGHANMDATLIYAAKNNALAAKVAEEIG
jgi:hypothetical protein